MKALIILSAASISFTACTSTPDKTIRNTDSLSVSPVTVPDTLCFRKLDGAANQDTTSLQMIIDGKQVSGFFAHYPFQKDRRVGEITATISDDLIKGIWTYMQEGINDTLDVEFKLNGDKLIQKSYTIDPATGREIISDTSVFNIELNKVDCL